MEHTQPYSCFNGYFFYSKIIAGPTSPSKLLSLLPLTMSANYSSGEEDAAGRTCHVCGSRFTRLDQHMAYSPGCSVLTSPRRHATHGGALSQPVPRPEPVDDILDVDPIGLSIPQGTSRASHGTDHYSDEDHYPTESHGLVESEPGSSNYDDLDDDDYQMVYHTESFAHVGSDPSPSTINTTPTARSLANGIDSLNADSSPPVRWQFRRMMRRALNQVWSSPSHLILEKMITVTPTPTAQ